MPVLLQGSNHCLRRGQRLARRCWPTRRYLCRIVAVILPTLLLTQTNCAETSEQAVYQLPESVVQAWHFDQSLMELPADVIRIERDAIEQSLASSVPDLLALEANLFFSNLAGHTNVSMRGFGEGSGLRSLILVDGQALNPADMGRINWEQIPLDAVESIEVLRGGHNVLYGDKALSGVIKIETRASGGDRLNLAGRLGSFGTQQASVAAARAAGRTWTVSGGRAREQSDGYRDHSATATRNGYLKLDRNWNEAERLSLRLAAGELDLTYPGGLSLADYQAHPRASSNLGDEGSFNRYATLSLRASGQRDWGNWEVLGGFDHNDVDWTLGAGAYGSNIQASFNLKPRLRYEFKGWALVAGTDLLRDQLDFTRYLDPSRRLVLSEAELQQQRVSPYLFSETQLGERWTLSGGLRHEWVRFAAENRSYVEKQLQPTIPTIKGPRPNPDFKQPPDLDPATAYQQHLRETGLSGELSLNFRLTDQLSLWAGYDRAYRYPVFDERAAYQGRELAQSVAHDLEAETGHQYELGVKWHGGAHQIDVTCYHLRMENEIIFDPTVGRDDPTTPGNGLNRNLGAVERTGSDLAYYYSAPSWGFSTALAGVHTRMRAGIDGAGVDRQVPLVPSIIATSQLWWQPDGDLRLRLIHRWISERYQGGDFANELPQVEAYSLVHLQGELRLNSQCRIFAKVDNVLNKRYAESVYAGAYYPGPGRSLQLGLRLDF